MNFNQLLLIAFVVESLIQTFKPIYDRQKGWNKDVLIALGISILFCVLIRIDLFSIVGMPINLINETVGKYVGAVLTGMIASRGSNLAHDLLKYVESLSGFGGSSGSSGSAVG